MYVRTKVKSINSDRSVLLFCSADVCSGCKAKMFCNNKNENEYLALNPNNYNLLEGEEVEIFLPPAKTIASTFLVFGLPLLLFPLGYYLTKTVFSVNELLCSVGGFLAMAFAFVIAAFINLKNKKQLMPVITKVFHIEKNQDSK